MSPIKCSVSGYEMSLNVHLICHVMAVVSWSSISYLEAVCSKHTDHQ